MVSRREFIQIVRDQISTGAWPPGTRLPSTRLLAEHFGMSTSSVDQAMAILLETGEIVSLVGGYRMVPGGPLLDITADLSKIREL